MANKKLKKLQHELENIENPNIEIDQYTTMPHIAACVLHTAQFVYDDIAGKCVADLGCGSGILCIGAALLNANYCAGFDKDPSAISLSVENASKRNLKNCCDFILCDIKNIDNCVQAKSFDTVIMNHPFRIKGMESDLYFLRRAINLASKTVYSIHKTSIRKHIINMAKKLGVYAKVIAEVRFDLPASYNFHKQDSFDIHVDIMRFSLTPRPAIHYNYPKLNMLNTLN